MDPGGPRAPLQWARLAIPFATGEQAELLRAGVPAVELSVSGEEGPRATTAIAPGRIERFGRVALRALTALDNGPTIRTGPQAVVLTNRKVLPMGGPPARRHAAAPGALRRVDGLARARRRREHVGRWVVWVLGCALPFAAVALAAVLLALTGLLPAAPRAPVPPDAVSVDGPATVGLVTLALVFALGWIAARPLLQRVTGTRERPQAPGAGVGLLLVFGTVVVLVWLSNPYAASLLVPALHLSALIAAGDRRLPRAAAPVVVLVGLVPVLIAVQMIASSLGYGPGLSAWALVLAVAGGHMGPLSWLVLSVLAGCAVAGAAIGVSREPRDPQAPDAVTVRGPVTYAGPGALGGVDSALRR